MDIQEYNNFILEIKRQVLEVMLRVMHSNNEDGSEIHYCADAATKEFQEKSLENIVNVLRDSELKIQEAKELSYEDEAVAINNDKTKVFKYILFKVPCFFNDIDNGDTLGSPDKEAHPFTRNNLVLSIIFGFLNGDSLKQCRLVNHNWKEICDPFFMKKIQISIYDLKRFLLNFSGNSKLECGRYKFGRGTNFIISDFQKILLKDLATLTSLTLYGVKFFDEAGILGGCNLNEILGGNNIFLKKLRCDSPGLVVPVERLVDIEYLYLDGCKIIFPEGYDGKICSPLSIKLVDISIIRPTGEEVEQILVNSFANVRKAKEIIIKQNIFVNTKLGLNLEEPNEEIMNNVVVIGEVNILINRLFKLKALTVDCREYDLSTLPESLECLFLSPGRNQNVQENAIPPNLKYFYCSFFEIPLWLPNFSVCSQLKFVYLTTYTGGEGQCDLSWLPPSVETLMLINIQPTFRNERQLNVKDFILIDCTNDTILETLIGIKAENLYLSFKESSRSEQNSQIVHQIYQQRYYGKTFKVGPFIWQDNNEFQHSPIFHIVDKRAGSYTFEEGLGKADISNMNDSNDEFGNTMSIIRFYDSSRSSVEKRSYFSLPHFFKPHWKYTP